MRAGKVGVGGTQRPCLGVHLAGECFNAASVVAGKRIGHIVGALDQETDEELAAGIDFTGTNPEFGRLNSNITRSNAHWGIQIASVDHDKCREDLLRACHTAGLIRIAGCEHGAVAGIDQNVGGGMCLRSTGVER